MDIRGQSERNKVCDFLADNLTGRSHIAGHGQFWTVLMYCLDDDIHCICEHCGAYNCFESGSIDVGETRGRGSWNTLGLNCGSCNSFVTFSYSLAAGPSCFDGYRSMVSRISCYGVRLIDKVSIIYDPMYVSRIRNIDAATYHRILQLIDAISLNPDLRYGVSRWDFEYIVAELVRRKGFAVEVVQQTRDGGKDIVAIKNIEGVPIKLFVECKHPERGSIVGVDIVRALYGVHGTQDEPTNRSLLRAPASAGMRATSS